MDVNAQRYEELVNRLLDGECSPVEAGELAETMRGRPELAHDLRHHLQLWELWSQEKAAERSAEAFLAAFRTRQRAEAENESFLTTLNARLSADRGSSEPSTPPATTKRWRARFVHPLRHPATLAWAASVTIVVTLAMFWLLAPRTAEAKTMHGEALCTNCLLHETREHLPAIRVNEGGKPRLYRLQCTASHVRRIGDFCAAPIPVAVTGAAASRDGILVFDVSAIEVEPPAFSPNAKPEERTLFPF